MAGLLIVVVSFSALVLFSVVLLSRQRMSPQSLDLTSVREAMVEKHGWAAERAQVAEIEYVRFLTLLPMKPGFMLVPWLDAEGRDDLDQFWHQHILDTAKYAADCKALFGKMIHHNPHVMKGSEKERESIEKTRRLYARRFNSGTYVSDVDVGDYSGCSACAAEADGGHGHSSHHGGDSGHGGDGGGDGGGHGCGHGCGGHGCGGH